MEASPSPVLSRVLAETVGTALLVVVGVVSVFSRDQAPVVVALALGLTYTALTFAFGRVSGGHLNPAITVGAALAGRLSWGDAGKYVAGQVLGGLLGGVVVLVTVLAADLGYETGDPLGLVGGFGDNGTYALFGALLFQLVLTFVVVLVVLAARDGRHESVAAAPVAIGFVVTATYLAAVPATGGGLNPALSIATAPFSGSDAIVQLWLFVLAPLLGAAAAGLLHPAIFGRDADPVPGSGLALSSGTAGAQQPWAATPQTWGAPGASAPAAGQGWGGASPYAGQQAPQAGQPGQHAAYAAPAAPAAPEPPIIQDGWQWDPQAQQWFPAPSAPSAPTGGDPGAGERTQIRPQG
ncbi:aquaporin [Nocardioides sp.]|uniref:aquaporin n=1 Tax=Nocardioides sp. TaxID=35761 RepID=UPI00351765FD